MRVTTDAGCVAPTAKWSYPALTESVESAGFESEPGLVCSFPSEPSPCAYDPRRGAAFHGVPKGRECPQHAGHEHQRDQILD
jgi:hypothetical protein